MFRSVRSWLAAPMVIAAAACSTMPAADQSQMQFVQAANVRTHVETWGAGPPVLLIHGASSDMAVFAPTVIPLLKGSYQLTAYDRPGMGLTAQRPANADQDKKGKGEGQPARQVHQQRALRVALGFL